MTIQEVLNYVMTTPYNTNRQILKSMLEEISEGGEGGDILIITPEQETADGYIVDFSELTADYFVLETTKGSFLGIFVEDLDGVTHVLLCSEDGGPAEIFTIDSTEDQTELTYESIFTVKKVEDYVKTCTITIDEKDVSNLEISAPSLAPLSGWSLTYLPVDNSPNTIFYYLVDDDGDGGIQLDVEIKVADKALGVKSNNATITSLETTNKWFLSNIEDNAAVVLQLIDDK